MIPGKSDIVAYQGDDYEYFFRVRNRNSDGTVGSYKDLTGYVGASQVRATESSSTVIATPTVTLADQTAATGGVYVRMTATVTAAITPANNAVPVQVTLPSGDVVDAYKIGVWDIQFKLPDARIQTYLRGNVYLVLEVTKVL